MMTTRVPLVEETACNVCGELDYRVVSQRDRDGRPLRTTICRRCGLVWTNPRPTLDALGRYYGEQYREDYKGMPVPTPRKLLRGILVALDRRRRLQPFLRPGHRVLDVGCGAGEFVYVLRAAGVDAHGLEPDIRYVEYSRDVLKIPIEAGVVGSTALASGPGDLITMFHVLEHVGDPVQTLAWTAGSLKTSGLLVVEVPNVEAECQAPQRRFHYAHLFSFSEGTLTSAVARAGFNTVRVELSPDRGNIIAIFRKRHTEPPELHGPESAGQYERTMRVLRKHTVARHYLSATPYRRAAQRLAARLREDRLLSRLGTAERILQWADTELLDER